MRVLLTLLLAMQAIPSAPPGIVTGRVRSNDGLAAAQVRILIIAAEANTPGFPKETATDESGQYRIGDIPPGNYYVAVGLPGRSIYESIKSAGTEARPVSIRSRSLIEGVDFVLDESATELGFFSIIVGRGAIVPVHIHVGMDAGLSLPALSMGKPMQVTARPVSWIGGIRLNQVREILSVRTGAHYRIVTREPAKPVDAKASVGSDGETTLSLSDRGEYQFFIENVPEEFEVKSITWGAIDLRRFTLQAMNNFVPSGIQIRLGANPRARRTGATVRGRFIDGLTGKDWTATAVFLSGAPGTLFADGSFQFSNVKPGAYVLSAREGSSGEREAETEIVVRGDDMTTNVVFTSVPTYVAMKGRVVLEDGAPLPKGVRVLLRNKGPLAVEQDGTFKTSLAEGAYEVSVADLPTEFVLKSISSGSENLSAAPLRINPRDGPTVPELVITLAAPAHQ